MDNLEEWPDMIQNKSKVLVLALDCTWERSKWCKIPAQEVGMIHTSELIILVTLGLLYSFCLT